MRKNHTPALAAAMVLSMILLSGCTDLPGKADADSGLNSTGVQQDLGAALQQEIGKAAAGLEKSVEKSAEKVKDSFKVTRISKQLSTEQEIGSSSVLSLENPVGEVEVKPVSGTRMTVTATLWLEDKTSHEADREKISGNAEVSIQISGDEIKVSTHAKDHPQKDLWTWAQDELDYSNFSIDYVIGLPEGVDRYEITNNVGEVRLQNLKGTYRIAGNVGAIKISGAEISGESSVSTDTGSIRLDIAEMKDGSSFKARTEVGSLTAVLAESLKCTLEAKSELGSITGAAGGTKELNGGGPLISLSTQIGAITIQN